MNGDHPSRLEIAEQIKEKWRTMPGNMDKDGWTDLDRAINESAERNRNQGWTEAEIVAANQPAPSFASPTGMKPNRAQGGSAGGTTPMFDNTVEGRMRQQTAKMKFDEGGGTR